MMDGGATGYISKVHKYDWAKNTRQLYFPILRYAPNTYLRYHDACKSSTVASDALDATGPFYWKFVRNLPRIQEINNETVDMHSGNREIFGHVYDELVDSS